MPIRNTVIIENKLWEWNFHWENRKRKCNNLWKTESILNFCIVILRNKNNLYIFSSSLFSFLIMLLKLHFRKVVQPKSTTFVSATFKSSFFTFMNLKHLIILWSCIYLLIKSWLLQRHCVKNEQRSGRVYQDRNWNGVNLFALELFPITNIRWFGRISLFDDSINN